MGVMCSFLLFVEYFRGLSVKFAIAIYPREGTETLMVSSVIAHETLQFIPARGRKLFHQPASFAICTDCNLSP